nr:T-box transcription factor TBX20 [Crassostrea gigas]
MDAKMFFQPNNVENGKQSKLFNPKREKMQNSVSSSATSSISPSNGSSSPELEVQSSDTEVCQMYANSSSSSSGYSEMQWSSDFPDDENNCIPQINGSITLSLMEAKLWYKFLEVGTEMIINRTGRRMFPYVEFSLRGVDPVGLYDVIFDIIPASSKSFKFMNNKWIPIGRKEEEFKNYPFKHPDSPRIGSDWMTRKISFEKVKLSNKPGTQAGIFTLHTLQKYLVRISIVKHEQDDEISVVEFPIRATTFIAVTAYNNREVTKLKIYSNPYSKGFRFPMKRIKHQTFQKIEHKEQRLMSMKDSVKHSVFYHLKGDVQAIPQCPLDLSTHKENIQTNDYKGAPDSNPDFDKATQTDITMADMRTWYRFLQLPVTKQPTEAQVSYFIPPPLIPAHAWKLDTGPGDPYTRQCPETSSRTRDSSALMSDEKKTRARSRKSEKKEEQLLQYNARMNMWKRDREETLNDITNE